MRTRSNMRRSWPSVMVALLGFVGLSCRSFYADTVPVTPPPRAARLEPGLATLPFEARAAAIDEALHGAGAEPLAPPRERRLASDTILALESMDVVAGGAYLVMALANEPRDLRMVVVGARGDRLADDVGLGPDAWVRFVAPRTERARIRVFSASGEGQFTLLRHREASHRETDPSPALRAPRPSGMSEEFGRVDAEMRARGFLPVQLPVVGQGLQEVPLVLAPGECYGIVLQGRSGEPARLEPPTEIPDALHPERGREWPMAAHLCPRSSAPTPVFVSGSEWVLGVYRRAVLPEPPLDRWVRAAWMRAAAIGLTVLLHQEGYELTDVSSGRVLWLSAGECYALALQDNRHRRIMLEPVDREGASFRVVASRAVELLWEVHCAERDEQVRVTAVVPWYAPIHVFRRVSAPLDALTAGQSAAPTAAAVEASWAARRLLELEGYVEVPVASWGAGQELRAHVSLAADSCYAVVADTDAHVEGTVRMGRWRLSAAATGPFALRFCPPVAGRYSVELRTSAPLQPAQAQLLRGEPQRRCGLLHTSRHARAPEWVGRGPSARVQWHHASEAFDRCHRAGRAVRSSLWRYGSSVNLERGPTLRDEPIVVGGADGDGSACTLEARRASAGWPPLVEPELHAMRLALSAEALGPLVEELGRYYHQGHDRDDGRRRGRELHPLLVGLYQAASCAHEDLARDLDALYTAALREVIDTAVRELADPERRARYQRLRVLVLARELSATAHGILAGDRETDLGTYEARLTALQIAVNTLQAGGLRVEGSDSLVAPALELGRAARRGRRAEIEAALGLADAHDGLDRAIADFEGSADLTREGL